jgi:hypothetical protein
MSPIYPQIWFQHGGAVEVLASLDGMTESTIPSPAAPHDPTPVLRLKSPADLIETVPYLVGFHPKRSIVMICMRARRLHLTMRLDLPPSAHARKAAGVLVPHAVQQGAEMVLLACYPEGPADRTAAARMVSQLRRELRLKKIAVREAVRVEDGRWWSYLCRNEECCPAVGTPLPDTPGRAAVAAVMDGLVALPDRSGLYDRLAPVDDIALTAAEQASTDAAATWAEHAAAKTLEAWRATELEFLGALAERYAAGAAPLTPAEAGRALVAVQDIEVRDACATWWDEEARSASCVPLWTGLVRHAPSEYVAPAATLLAGCAWLSGEGALANVALERVYGADPSYRLARLLDAAIQGGVSPQRWRATAQRLSAPAQEPAAD